MNSYGILPAGSNVSRGGADQALKSFLLPRSGFHLTATLDSGQSFCWNQESDELWRGWIGKVPTTVKILSQEYLVSGFGLSEAQVKDYFALDFDLAQALATFPTDPFLSRALAFSPGLRILRQPIWETLACFICSSVKQISQIKQINQELRQRLGEALWPDSPELKSFPDYRIIAMAGEPVLREAKLGFRARHLHRTASVLVERGADLESWQQLSTDEIKSRLVDLPGVGEKIANCVLLFAFHRLEVFPIDVWVERILKQLYFPRARNKSPERLRAFALEYFGPYRGLAQQYLFHWMRMGRK